MPQVANFPVVEPDSARDYSFDFASYLSTGVTLSSAAFTIIVRRSLSGYTRDPNPSSHLDGAPTTTPEGAATQRVSDLVAGNDYILSAEGTLSNGEQVILWAVLPCRPVGGAVVTGGQVAFDYLAWLDTYPEFVDVTEVLAQSYFDEATIYHRNDGTGPVTNDAEQLRLLNMLVAHIAATRAAGQPLAGSPIVGQITSASEGSVSISGNPLSEQGVLSWLLTTKYGSDYWYATAAYRTARYVLAPQRQFNPPFFRAFWR